MPSKEQQRKEAMRLRCRTTRETPNDGDDSGGPSSNQIHRLGISQEPTTSNAIETPIVNSNDADNLAPLIKKPRGDGVRNFEPTVDKDLQYDPPRQIGHIRANIVPSGDGNARRVNLRLIKNTKIVEQRMRLALADYQQRSWPSKTASRSRRRSTCRTQTRCGDDCTCTNYAQCQQNASAFIACVTYMNEFKHVDYYDSGQFGDFICQHCGARLLRGEHEKIKGGRQTPCCANGDAHTDQMLAELEELQLPPNDFIKGLVGATDERLREAFLNNTMPFNNTFAFASTHGEKAPAEQMGGRMDTCKYNGEFSFMFSDLIAPEGRRPTFAQVYTLTPEAALGIREENFDTALAPHIKTEIICKLEELIRENPFGRAFQTVGTKVQAATAATGAMPHFQIVLLTDRDLKSAEISNRGDVTLIERADAPSAKQVAVIWIQEDGLPPQISGFWLSDKAGKMRELKNGMPQIDPCCFPLLHPRGTLGWRWFIKKRGCVGSREAHQQLTINDISNLSMDASHPNDDCVGQQVGTSENVEPELVPEPECQLDADLNQGTSYDTEVGTSTQGTQDIHKEDPVFENEVTAVPGRTNISEKQFYKYRMAIRGDDKTSFHWLWFARRLAEYFTITVLNRIERNDLEHLKDIQRKKNYRRILAREYIAAMEKGLQKWGRNAKLGSVFLMPQTFAGSRQYYQSKYADLMTMVRHLGAPTWFITFTGNPKWPEITEALRGRQNYVHRPDIVCRIFMDKAAEFIKDVTERCVLGPVAGWCYSVEHQSAGGRISTPEQVDEYVSARIPKLPPLNDHSPEANQQRRLWHYVTTMMLHDCNAACLEGSRCRKHFPKPYSDHTELSEVRYTSYVRLAPGDDLQVAPRRGDENQVMDDNHIPATDPERDWAEVRYTRIPCHGRLPERQHDECGQTHFKRRKGGRGALLLDDSRVIPYNSYLLLKYGCHVNIEYVFGQKACKYIFKYLLKGFEKAYVQVAQPRRNASRRSGDDTEQTFDYDEIAATFKVRYMTAMEAYLRLHSYKIVGTSHQIYTLSVHDEGGQTIVVEEGHEEEGQWKVKENTRLTSFFMLCRTDPDAALLTYDRVPYFYSTVDGIFFSTFAGAAQHLGLQVCDELFIRSMQEACAEISNLKRLQHFFAMLIAHANPSEPQKLFDQFLDEMNPPVAGAHPGAIPKSIGLRTTEVMKNIEYFLNCMGTNSGNVGLSGLPEDYDFQRQATLMEEDNLLDDFYGKTFFYNTLIKWCVAGKPMLSDGADTVWGRDKDSLRRSAVIAAASTGIAALLLIGGGTAHRHFFVPNDVTDETAPMLNFEAEKAQQLREADLIIIDEISMLSSKVLRYIERLLRDVCAGALPFGGKVIVLSGDWRQLAPVVEHGTREDQVAESIKMDRLFKGFEKLSLTINMRTAPGEHSLREWLNEIGSGQSKVGTNQIHIPPQLVLQNLDEAIQFCFPDGLFKDPLSNADAIANNAVLCPTNNDVQYINEIALARMSGDAKEFPSIDEPLEPNDDYTISVLTSTLKQFIMKCRRECHHIN
ncbi:hypothetical protein niasHS_015485 [Heterodera schachtii]|uniref:ATP-dependent DNA helicase n=1 Tax=Heterodera schachtii TaxID=97005 RepID=A0ABD2IKC8_HETSC